MHTLSILEILNFEWNKSIKPIQNPSLRSVQCKLSSWFCSFCHHCCVRKSAPPRQKPCIRNAHNSITAIRKTLQIMLAGGDVESSPSRSWWSLWHVVATQSQGRTPLVPLCCSHICTEFQSHGKAHSRIQDFWTKLLQKLHRQVVFKWYVDM